MWYRLTFNPEPKIMGCDTQVKALHDIALDFQDKLFDITFTEPLVFDKIIDFVELKAKAKFTYVLWDYSLKGRAIFISQQTKALLDQFKLLNTEFYPAMVKKGTNSRQYFCLRMHGDISDKIDYMRSKFMWYKSDENKEYPVQFLNEHEMLNKKREVGPIDSINATNLFLKNDFIDEGFNMIFLGRLAVTGKNTIIYHSFSCA